MNRVSAKRRQFLCKKPVRPHWWPTAKDMNDPQYDAAVNEIVESEDRHIVEKLRTLL
jgi:hypothetical protein